jgi:hypothetical protein
MKRLTMLAGLTLMLSWHFSAQADNRLDGMKKMNAEGCVESIKFEEHAPKESKQVKPYCYCVYEVYYNGFTPAEQNQLFAGVLAPEKLQKSLPARLEAAQAQCRKKIGF